MLYHELIALCRGLATCLPETTQGVVLVVELPNPSPGRFQMTTDTQKTPEERKELLARTISSLVARGGRVESQSDYQAVIVMGHRPNHTLHGIVTIFTCLLWGIVWAIITGTGGEKRQMVNVDEWGNVTVAKV